MPYNTCSYYSGAYKMEVRLSAPLPQAHVGEMLAVPSCAIGEVVAIETLDLGEDAREYYRIQLRKGVRSWVPVGRLAEQGIRRVMTRKHALETLRILGSQEAPEKRTNWNRRQRRYTETMLHNEPTGLAALLGELDAVRKQKGTLSFTERRFFEKVHTQLVAELSIALEVEPEAAESRVQEALEGPA